METVKITTPWNHSFYAQTPGGRGIAHGYRFEIDNGCAECDHWIVWGGLRKQERVVCPPGNVYYLTDESHAERKFDQRFLNQFPRVIACRTDLQHPAVIPTHDLGIWHFGKNYEEVAGLQPFPKDKALSVVSSDLTLLEGHKKRFAFVNKMIGHFKDRLDVFGRGFAFIPDKYDGIAGYQYSIAIENSAIPGYFTEKLFECYLTYTMPIYYGCPDIGRYFDERSLLVIDIDDYRGSIRKIEEALAGDLYARSLAYIAESRQRFLDRYHVFAALAAILRRQPPVAGPAAARPVTLVPEAAFGSSPAGELPRPVRKPRSLLTRLVQKLGVGV